MVDRRKLFVFLSSRPLGVGGYAKVFKARRRSDGRILAFKELISENPYALRRMEREIKAQRGLAHPNIMPIWDIDPDLRWFTMPLAEGNLKALRPELNDEDLAKILASIANGLVVAHKKTEIHRDLKPENILAIREEGDYGDRRWVIADWGHVRLSSVGSSSPLTRQGTPLGTDGYAAPELLEDAHNATPAADIYSLGRIAAWFLSGQRPIGERPLNPPKEMQHWRGLVRACTEPDIHRRVPDVAAFRKLLDQVFQQPLIAPATKAMELAAQALADDGQALATLITLAEDNPDDADVYLDGLAQIPGELLRVPVAQDPDAWCKIGIRMARFLLDAPWGGRDTSYAATPLGFVYRLLRRLVDIHAFEEAEDLARLFFAAEVHWQCQSQRIKTVEWLTELGAHAGTVIARSLRATQGAVGYYRSLGLAQPGSPALAALIGLRAADPEA